MPQTFGLTNWKATAPIKLIGWAASPLRPSSGWRGSAQAVSRAKCSRYSAPASVSSVCNTGRLANKAARPNQASSNTKARPALTPRQCGNVRRTPKRSPDDSSIKLFGPGVIDVPNASAASCAAKAAAPDVIVSV